MLLNVAARLSQGMSFLEAVTLQYIDLDAVTLQYIDLDAVTLQ